MPTECAVQLLFSLDDSLAGIAVLKQGMGYRQAEFKRVEGSCSIITAQHEGGFIGLLLCCLEV
ncbi:hypothetical protein SDC9_67021 [bioreactor metagenome]|uniref:Uncharacterized protein n=1 Tax=bioreactor metagenome TaxID=1076179 RepID=A0A644XWI7_9ZZZZ